MTHRLRPTLLFFWVPLLGACSTLFTPETIGDSGGPEESRATALCLFDEALLLANEFLASPQRLSLPAAHYERTDEEPLVFLTESERWPIRIRHQQSVEEGA